MKKITFFICTLSSGGAEHQMSILAKLLAEKGYDIEIVTFGDEPDHYPLTKKIKRTRIAPEKSRLRKALAIFKFFSLVKTDCIISFEQRNNAVMLPAMFFRPKIRVIAGERNCTMGVPDHIEMILFKFLYRRANWIVPNSYSQAKHIEHNYPSFYPKVHVIINYTNLDEYMVQPNENSDMVQIGVFCRYAPQKNYERFLSAIALLVKRGHTNFKVHWYGAMQKLGQANPDYVRFAQLVEEIGLQTYVYPLDSVTNVAQKIPRYDVLCIPSLYEGFSNSLSEYICCGRPVLASDVSDNVLMVHDGENGFLFNPENVEEITAAFKKMLSLSPEERYIMGVKSRKIAEELFNKDRFVDDYVNLIEQEK